MTPAKEVGGDLYGYLLQGDKLYVAVGDVSGKGVPASLFMAQATRLFQTMAKQGMMPAEICTHMNDALSGDDNENGMFVTFWLGLVDLQTGHLNYCNAGHNPPIIGGGDHHGDFLDMIPNAPIGLCLAWSMSVKKSIVLRIVRCSSILTDSTRRRMLSKSSLVIVVCSTSFAILTSIQPNRSLMFSRARSKLIALVPNPTTTLRCCACG